MTGKRRQQEIKNVESLLVGAAKICQNGNDTIELTYSQVPHNPTATPMIVVILDSATASTIDDNGC